MTHEQRNFLVAIHLMNQSAAPLAALIELMGSFAAQREPRLEPQ